MPLRIVTLNCWGGRVWPDLRDWVGDIDADIYCLQEVHHEPTGTLDAVFDPVRYHEKGYGTIRANLFGDLQKILPNHVGTFCPFARYTVPDLQKKGKVAIYVGIATFVRRGIPIIASIASFVHGDFRDFEVGEMPLPRTAHVVRIVRSDTGKSLVVGHMHGLWDKSGKKDNVERAHQAIEFKRLLRQAEGPSQAEIVACGDWNVLPGTGRQEDWQGETFRYLKELGLRDLVTFRGFTSTRSSHYTNRPERKDASLYADYMCVTPGLMGAALHVVEEPVISDHLALLLDLQ